MLIICVQPVNNKTDLKCLKHTNQKREKEQKPTVSWFEAEQRLAETHYLDDAERVVRL